MKKIVLSIVLWIAILAPITVIVGYYQLPMFHEAAELPDALLLVCCLLSAIGYGILMESGERPATLTRDNDGVDKRVM